VSFQITVLKVLAGYPEGRASLEELRRAVAILISSGPDWTDRTKRLAARAPGLDIFTQAFVLRDKSGWQITEAGRALLASIETSATEDNTRRAERRRCFACPTSSCTTSTPARGHEASPGASPPDGRRQRLGQ